MTTSGYFGLPFGFFWRTSPNIPLGRGSSMYFLHSFFSATFFFLLEKRVVIALECLSRSSKRAPVVLNKGAFVAVANGISVSLSFTGVLLLLSATPSREFSFRFRLRLKAWSNGCSFCSSSCLIKTKLCREKKSLVYADNESSAQLICLPVQIRTFRQLPLIEPSNTIAYMSTNWDYSLT